MESHRRMLTAPLLCAVQEAVVEAAVVQLLPSPNPWEVLVGTQQVMQEPLSRPVARRGGTV